MNQRMNEGRARHGRFISITPFNKSMCGSGVVLHRNCTLNVIDLHSSSISEIYSGPLSKL